MQDKMDQTSRQGKRWVSDQTKYEAITRVKGGETKASVARHLDIPESTLRGWCKHPEKIIEAMEKSRTTSGSTDINADSTTRPSGGMGSVNVANNLDASILETSEYFAHVAAMVALYRADDNPNSSNNTLFPVDSHVDGPCSSSRQTVSPAVEHISTHHNINYFNGLTNHLVSSNQPNCNGSSNETSNPRKLSLQHQLKMRRSSFRIGNAAGVTPTTFNSSSSNVRTDAAFIATTSSLSPSTTPFTSDLVPTDLSMKTANAKAVLENCFFQVNDNSNGEAISASIRNVNNNDSEEDKDSAEGEEMETDEASGCSEELASARPPIVDVDEAIETGEKFMNWVVENGSGPSGLTVLEFFQLKSILNKLKNRRNPE